MPTSVIIFVLAIVIVTMVSRIMQERYRAIGRQKEGAADSGETIRLRQDVQILRERIQVLERVVTDNNRSLDLDREIERLRDR